MRRMRTPRPTTVTERDSRIIEAVRTFTATHQGMPPTFRDVATLTALNLGTVASAVAKLRNMGKLSNIKGSARSLRVVSDGSEANLTAA